MFVDEISMVDLTMLSLIDNHCKIAKSLDRSSPEFFSGLPTVIFIGDFFQFPPVVGDTDGGGGGDFIYPDLSP